MGNQSQLCAGVAVADITPPLEVGLLTSSVNGTYAPFESVRLPLKARVLVLKSANDTVAIVSLDLLALNDTSVGGWENFKQSLSPLLSSSKIILTCTHTHSSPESVALSGLYLTESYRKWLLEIRQKIARAIALSIDSLQPCKVFIHTEELNGFSLQRRIYTPKGIVMSHSVQPIGPELMNKQPVDRRVRTIRFKNESGKIIATLVHAICHPVHEMCLPHVSPDFPGEMCNALDATGNNGVAIFLNGAMGDTNPPTVSEGPDCARRHGEALAQLAQSKAGETEVDDMDLKFAHSKVQFSARAAANINNSADAVARFSAIGIGSIAIVFLPGEPFVETALAIEKNAPFQHTIVAGLGENNIGYMPTEKAYDEGGYEVGPGKWAFLPKGTDKQVCAIAIGLLNELKKAGNAGSVLSDKNMKW